MHPRSLTLALVTTALGVAWLASVSAAPAEPKPDPDKKNAPKVEVVFCLDCTGSMSGLIDRAKQKIWAISNQIASGKPTPTLKIGLVAYRDRGDDFITQVVDLTDDLDAIHIRLMAFQAGGGGDEPESVNQALHDAVTKINWSKEATTLKQIYLVGDAAPHMDYKDDVKYHVSCKLAVENDIIVNTVQCGDNPNTKPHWREIADRAEGVYVQIPQDGGGAVAITTPFDAELAKINGELAKTILCYGGEEKKRRDEEKRSSAMRLPVAAAAERIGFLSKDGRVAAFDLLAAIRSNTVKLEDIRRDELPDELKNMTLDEQKKYLADLEKKRSDLQKQVLELDKKRGEHIAKELAKQGKPKSDSFDDKVLETLRLQAKRYKIAY